MKKFQQIYIEKEAKSYSLSKKFIDKYPKDKIIWIDHYKDVFCRPRQNYALQNQNQSLILAVKKDEFLYPGAPVCQDFGNKNFYWCSCVMNCVCNCQYCYLKGMYPSGHLVVFVNLEDYFKNFSNEEKYICASYDTDLFPIESEIGYIEKWLNFAKNNKKGTIEIRTKCKNLDVWNYEPVSNAIFAFSLSPQYIISEYEHKTSKLNDRLENIKVAQERGFKTRLCFDPIIYCKDWKLKYGKLIEKTVDSINISAVQDISIGSFRISQTYLKNMRKNDTESKIVNFPFVNVDGFYQYPPNIQNEMEQFLFSKLSNYFDEKRIYLWK